MIVGEGATRARTLMPKFLPFFVLALQPGMQIVLARLTVLPTDRQYPLVRLRVVYCIGGRVVAWINEAHFRWTFRALFCNLNRGDNGRGLDNRDGRASSVPLRAR